MSGKVDPQSPPKPSSSQSSPPPPSAPAAMTVSAADSPQGAKAAVVGAKAPAEATAVVDAR